MKIYIDGKLLDKESARISIFDHGLLYGDGVFEGIRAYAGLIFKLKEHIDRLYESAHAIMLKIPLDKRQLQDAVVKTIVANKLRDAYIRLIVTRGTGDLGLDPRKCKRPTIIIIADKITLYPQEYYRKGLALVTVPTNRNSPDTLSPQIKSLNYLNNILAKIEATNQGAEEAIMLNRDGYVTECTGENIFFVKRMALFTPPTYVGVLRGITRDAVLDIARRDGLEPFEVPFTRHDLYCADEVFLTGTAAEIVPVIRVDGRTIGRGLPGKVTLKLLNQFRELTKRDGVRV